MEVNLKNVRTSPKNGYQYTTLDLSIDYKNPYSPYIIFKKENLSFTK
jgi:hypothetical protein